MDRDNRQALRNQLKERIAPGLWIDKEDNLHVSVPEVLDELGWPHTQENKSLVNEVFEGLIRETQPEAKIVYREKPD